MILSKTVTVTSACGLPETRVNYVNVFWQEDLSGDHKLLPMLGI